MTDACPTPRSRIGRRLGGLTQTLRFSEDEAAGRGLPQGLARGIRPGARRASSRSGNLAAMSSPGAGSNPTPPLVEGGGATAVRGADACERAGCGDRRGPRVEDLARGPASPTDGRREPGVAGEGRLSATGGLPAPRPAPRPTPAPAFRPLAPRPGDPGRIRRFLAIQAKLVIDGSRLPATPPPPRAASNGTPSKPHGSNAPPRARNRGRPMAAPGSKPSPTPAG